MKSAARFFAFLALLIAVQNALPVFSEERILRYESTMSVERDSAVTVIERITVDIERLDIRHGIVRLFPVKYLTESGAKRRTGFELQSVTFDGKNVPYKISKEGNYAIIRIGNPVALAPRGTHVYEIAFRTSGHIRFMKDRDAIYWNVTGNDWDFPIDYASFRLMMPDGSEGKILASNAYTGYSGESGEDYRDESHSFFETTRPLEAGEGFTVVVEWEKGVTDAPRVSLLGRLGELYSGNRLFAAITWPLLVLLFFLPAWLLLGRDPPLGTVVPLFDPPEGMEPGMAALVRNMEVVPSCLTSNLTQLAVQGYIKFGFDPGGDVLISKAQKSPSQLAQPLSMLWNQLFLNKKTSFSVSRTNAQKTPLASAYMKTADYYEKKSKKLYERHQAIGYLVFLLMLVCVLLLSDSYPFARLDASNMAVRSLVFLIDELSFSVNNALGFALLPGIDPSNLLVFFSFFLVSNLVFVNWGVKWLKKSREKWYGAAHKALMFAGGVCFVLLGLGDNLFLLKADICLTVVLALTYALFYLFAVKLMPVRSKEGTELLRQVEGFAMYVTAEKEFLAQMNAPEDTLERYEEILPYAIALDVADAWNARFKPILEQSELSWGPDAEMALVALYSLDQTTRHLRHVRASSEVLSAPSWSGGGVSGGSSGGGSGGGGGRGW